MTPRNDEIIDFQKLTQRELLIKLSYDFKEVAQKLEKHIETTSKKIEGLEIKQSSTQVDVAKLETKVKSQSAFFGGLSGIITGLITLLIKVFIK